MSSDIEIAMNAKPQHILKIAEKLGIDEEYIECYGRYKAKISTSLLEKVKNRPDGKLILVTGITPTKAGEGKTVTTIGLVEALGKLSKKVCGALREPSLGPVFGIKGGATGGGHCQVYPMWDINLHFTGDIHAVSAAHNLLAAILDNHLVQGNKLGIDTGQILWRRVIDMNERALRNIVIGLGGKDAGGVVRESGFDITAASEIMAILALSQSVSDLKERLGRILVGYTYDKKPVFARDLQCTGAMAILLKDALNPNLVQTLEGNPVFIHCGPFANIAHGNNSVLATKMALKLADYVITESGFASDLGAEKFFDIVCPLAKLKPDCVVIVASVKALKLHGGAAYERIKEKDINALRTGLSNLNHHIENMRQYGLNVVVAINRFQTDAPEELEVVAEFCRQKGVLSAVSEVHEKGGEGGLELAKAVLEAVEPTEPGKVSHFRPIVPQELHVRDKIELIAKRVYGAEGVIYESQAQADIKNIESLGFEKLPVCIAKTQLSISDNPELLNVPTGWKLTIRNIRISSGAGFLVPIAGKILLMPGLPAQPAALKMDILEDGTIKGLS
ncbi:MAG: formate--tetrahydrofolate ligase [Thermoplasmata archaeon]